jgi:hypothetical protein
MAEKIDPEILAYIQKELDEHVKSCSLDRVEADFDVFTMSTQTPYLVNRDADGNLWFATIVKKNPKDTKNVGADVIKLDGDRATRFVFKGNYLKGGYLDKHTVRFAVDDKGTAWYFVPAGPDPYQLETPLFAIDRGNRAAAWGPHPAGRALDKHDDGETYSILDPKTGKKKSTFKTPAKYGKAELAGGHILIHSSYVLDVRTADGTPVQTLKWDDLESDPFFKSTAFDFQAPTPLDAHTLLVPFTNRQGRGTHLYTFDLKTRAFTPHKYNGLVKSGPDQCFFDKRGRLWVTHTHSPGSLFWTTFTIVDDGKVIKLDEGKPGKPKAKTKR